MDTYEKLKPVMEALLEAKGLDSIMKAVYDALGNPVILADQSLFTLAYHSERPIDDVAWNDAVSHGYSSDEFVERFYKEGVMDRIAQSAHPVIIDTGVGESIRRMHFRVGIGKKPAALFGMLEVERPFEEQDMLLVEEICKILSLELQRASATGERPGGRYKGVLYSLIIGKDIGSISRSLLKPKRLGDSKSYRVLVLDNSLSRLDSYYMNSIKRSIENTNPESMSFVLDEQQIILMGVVNEATFESRLSALEELLSKYDAYAGLSSSFEDLAEIRKYYLQSVESLKSGYIARTNSSGSSLETSLPHICRYRDCLVLIMLSKLEEAALLEDFVVPDLGKLDEYDKTNGTNYKETLKTYFLKGQSVKAVAAEMRIHRNTVSQRLAKITELLGPDALSGKHAFELNLSCYIEDYLSYFKA